MSAGTPWTPHLVSRLGRAVVDAIAASSKSRSGGLRVSTTTDMHRLMTADPGELDVEIAASSIEGRVPRELAGGSYVLNGPARIALGGRIAHPFDGHGFLRAFRFKDTGAVRLQTRFVRTEAFARENAAQRLLYAGIGTAVAPRRLNVRDLLTNIGALRTKNVANTTALEWGGKILCGWEGGVPHAVALSDLTTIGPDTFHGALEEARCLAHTRVDRRRGRLVTASLELGRQTRVVFREFDRAGRLVTTRAHGHPGSSLMHDFAVTENHYVFLENPLRIDFIRLGAAVAGIGALVDAIAVDEAARARLVLVPRDAPFSATRTVVLPEPLFAMHYANAFEDEDGTIVVDAVAFPKIEFGHELGFVSSDEGLDPARSFVEDSSVVPTSRWVRIRVGRDGDAARLERSQVTHLDFPSVPQRLDGRPSRFIYAARCVHDQRSSLFDTVTRLSADDLAGQGTSWTPGPGALVGEPLFVERPGAGAEDPGWVLVVVYEPARGRSSLCILQSDALEAGPIARVQLPTLLPFAFHGCFVPGDRSN